MSIAEELGKAEDKWIKERLAQLAYEIKEAGVLPQLVEYLEVSRNPCKAYLNRSVES